MFDFSMGKLLLLALIALLVLGPEKLPGAARTVGTLIRRVRRGWDSVREEMERELEIEEMRQLARKAAAEAEAAQTEASDTLRKMKEEMAKVKAETEAMAKEQKADIEAMAEEQKADLEASMSGGMWHELPDNSAIAAAEGDDADAVDPAITASHIENGGAPNPAFSVSEIEVADAPDPAITASEIEDTDESDPFIVASAVDDADDASPVTESTDSDEQRHGKHEA